MTLSQLVLALVVGLASGMISYLTASGMSLIISGMGTINFGQGAFYILGAMLCYYSVRANVPFIAALLIGFLVPAAIGALVEFLLRPVYGLDMTYSMLITMGVSYMLCDGMSFLWGNTVRATPVPQMLNGAVRIASMNIAKSPARSFTMRRTRRYTTHMLRQETISCGRRMTQTFRPNTARNGIIR